jgi:hypothetical protein
MPQIRVLVACTVAGLGLLLAAPVNPGPLNVARLGETPYPVLGATVAGLLAWHLAPRRAWAWCLLAGALCTAVVAAMVLELVEPTEANYLWLFGFARCAPVFTLIGLLGAATLVWHSGRRSVGAALAGAAVALWLTGPSVLFMAGLEWSFFEDVLPGLIVVLTAAGLVAGVVGLFLRVRKSTRPEWRVTLAGAVAAAAPVLHHLWDPMSSTTGRPDDYFELLALVLLAFGLVACAVVVGASGGLAILLATVAAGLLLGAFGVLLVMAMFVLSSTLTVLLILGGLAAGWLLAHNRLRGVIGSGGLIVVAAALVVLYLVATGSGDTDAALDILAPVLVVAGTIAAVTAGASLGDALAVPAASPAVFVGLATPFILALYLYSTQQWNLQRAPDEQPAELLVLPAGVLVVAALALAGLTRVSRRPAEDEPSAEPQPATPGTE